MNELIAAAKAVLDARVFTGPHRERLRAAVERAENHEPVGFDAWWDANADIEMMEVAIHKWDECWTAAQQAERERIQVIIKDLPAATSPSWSWVCDEILEKIDAAL